MDDVFQFYRERINALTAQLNQRKKRKTGFGVLRLGVVFAAILVFYLLWNYGTLYVVIAWVISGIVFTRIVLRDIENKNAIRHLQFQLKINRDEIKALEGEYFHYADGQEFTPKDHPYAQDMDVFGHASLFQFINRTGSEPGAAML